VAGRHPGPIQEAACWVHARRPFFASPSGVSRLVGLG
jgi:hypothetical protein